MPFNIRNMSHINMLNKSGPGIESWGTRRVLLPKSYKKNQDFLIFKSLMLYSYLKRMKHFLISVSVSKVNYRGRFQIVIFIATKPPWLWLSYLTRSLVQKALEKSCKWLLLCSLILKGTLMQIWKSTNIFVFTWK